MRGCYVVPLFCLFVQTQATGCTDCTEYGLQNKYDPDQDPNVNQNLFKLSLRLPEVWEAPPPDQGCLEVGVRRVKRKVVANLPDAFQFAFGRAKDDASSSSFQVPGGTIEASPERCGCIKWVNQLTAADGTHWPHLLDVSQLQPWAHPNGGTAMRDNTGNETDPYLGPVPMVTSVVGHFGEDHSSGYPQAWYLPDTQTPAGYASYGTLYDQFRNVGKPGWTKGSAVFEYCNRQKPTQLLYRDNTFGMSRYNQQVGMYGRYVIRGSEGVDLSKIPVVPLTIQDATFDKQGQYILPSNPYGCAPNNPDKCPPDFFGNVMLVNGRAWPKYDVNESCYRFRIINAASSRFFDLFFENINEFLLLSTGTGFLNPTSYPNGKNVSSVLIPPGGSADILVDFNQLVGNRIIMLNKGPNGPLTKDCSYSSCTNVGSHSNKIMAFDVVPYTATTSGRCPAVKLPQPDRVGDGSKDMSVAMVTQHVDCPCPAAVGVQCQGGSQCPTPVCPKARELHLNAYFKEAGTPTPRHFNEKITEICQPNTAQLWKVFNYGCEYDTLIISGASSEVIGATDYDGNTVDYPAIELGVKPVILLQPNTVTLVRVQCKSQGLFIWGSTLGERRDYDKKAPLCVGKVEDTQSCRVANREIIPQAREDLCLITTAFPDGDRCLTKDPASSKTVLDWCRGTENQLWLKPIAAPEAGVVQNVALMNGRPSCLAIFVVGDNGQGVKNVGVLECDSTDVYQKWRQQDTVMPRGAILSAAPIVPQQCLDWRLQNTPFGSVTSGVAYACGDTTALWKLSCGPDCLYNEWGAWSTCSVACGGGQRQRVRTAKLSGLPYCTDTIEKESCNTFACTVREQCMVRPVFDPYRKKCLTASSTGVLKVQPCTGEDLQRWTYRGTVLRSVGLVNGLEVCATVAPDLSVRAWPCPEGSETKDQKWTQYFDAMISVSQGLCLEVVGGIDWTMDLQNVALHACRGSANQAWAFDCTAEDACVNRCPFGCLCQLDRNMEPYCKCPGVRCDQLLCLNGGWSYYNGNDCLCMCSMGFTGPQCAQPLTCIYDNWSPWSPCTATCGDGQQVRTRLPLAYPELCTQISETVSCFLGPCDGGVTPLPGVVNPPAVQNPPYVPEPLPLQSTGTKTCRLQLTLASGQTRCLQVDNGLQVTAASCTNAPVQQWQFDGQRLINAGKCLTISSTDVQSQPCTGADNQRFTLSGNQLKGAAGNCVQLDAGSGAVRSLSCSTATGSWSMACASSQSQTDPINSNPQNVTVVPEGCALTLAGFPDRCITTDGGRVTMGSCDGTSRQQWIFGSQDKTVRTPAFPNQCLDISGGMRGNSIGLWSCNGQPNQEFFFDGTNVRASDLRCLDVSGGVTGTDLLVWQCSDAPNQKWTRKCADTNVPTTPNTPPPSTSCGEWGSWGACSVSCGHGIRARTRSLTAGCAQPVETQLCNPGECLPIDCTYTAWTQWTQCSNTCDGGFSVRLRKTTSATVSQSGPCTDTAQIRLCNLQSC